MMNGTEEKKNSVKTAEDAAQGPFCKQRILKPIYGFICRQWFLIGVALAILLGYLIPEVGKKGGYLHPEYTVKYVLVPIIFIFSGISLKTRELLNSLGQCKFIITVQSYIFVFIPAFVFGIAQLLILTGMDERLITGLIVAACMPCTVSMANILTTAADGNVAASVTNTAISNLAGIVITPALVLLLIGNQSSIDYTKTLLGLSTTLLLPIIVGQIIQYIAGARITPRLKKIFKTISTVLLLVIIFCSFCDAFSQNTPVGPGSLAATFVTVILLYIVLFTVSRLLFAAPCYHFTKRLQVAGWFLSTHKTVAAGIPLMNVMYADNLDLGIMCIPLLIWHSTQLVIGSVLVPFGKAWVKEEVEAAEKKEQDDKNSLKPSGEDADQKQGMLSDGVNDIGGAGDGAGVQQEEVALEVVR